MNTLRRLRIDKPMTVEELSAETGVKVTTIYNLERGDIKNPRLSTLVPLAEFFKVPPSSLVPGVVVDPEPLEEAS
jgi:transcriptional regulator with XRE-family HTH domain